MFFLRFIKFRYLESVYGLKRGKGKKGVRGKKGKEKKSERKQMKRNQKKTSSPTPSPRKVEKGL